MPAGPAGCLRSRWRSSLRKWRNDATPRGRSQKAPSTRRCIKTPQVALKVIVHIVRKHPAPEGALRLQFVQPLDEYTRQKAPSTRRCIKTTSRIALAGRAMIGQKAPSTRRCIKTVQDDRGWRLQPSVRKHPAPEGALRHGPTADLLDDTVRSESTQHQKACSPELPCGGCQQRRKTVSPTASPLNRPSEPTRTTPPPRAPPSSTTTKASTPGGFVPGELAGFQQASRNRNASTAETGQQTQSQAGRAKEPSRLLVARSRDAVNASADQHPCPTPTLLQRRRRGRTMTPPKERLPTPAFNL